MVISPGVPVQWGIYWNQWGGDYYFFLPLIKLRSRKKKKKRLSTISICSSWKACIPNPISNKVSAHLCATQTGLLSPFPANLTPGWQSGSLCYCGKELHRDLPFLPGSQEQHSHGAAPLHGCPRAFSWRRKAEPLIVILLTKSKGSNHTSNKEINPKPTTQTPPCHNFPASREKYYYTIPHFHTALSTFFRIYLLFWTASWKWRQFATYEGFF